MWEIRLTLIEILYGALGLALFSSFIVLWAGILRDSEVKLGANCKLPKYNQTSGAELEKLWYKVKGEKDCLEVSRKYLFIAYLDSETTYRLGTKPARLLEITIDWFQNEIFEGFKYHVPLVFKECWNFESNDGKNCGDHLKKYRYSVESAARYAKQFIKPGLYYFDY